MYRKMLLHVVERMKHDKIVFETRKNGLEWELADKVKTMNTISGLETGVNEEEDRLRNISSKFAMHVDEEQRGRKSHL